MNGVRLSVIGLIVVLLALIVVAQVMPWAIQRDSIDYEVGSRVITKWGLWKINYLDGTVQYDKKCPPQSAFGCVSGALLGARIAPIGVSLLLPLLAVPIYYRKYEGLAIALLGLSVALIVATVALWFVWQGSNDSGVLGAKGAPKGQLGLGAILAIVALVIGVVAFGAIIYFYKHLTADSLSASSGYADDLQAFAPADDAAAEGYGDGGDPGQYGDQQMPM